MSDIEKKYEVFKSQLARNDTELKIMKKKTPQTPTILRTSTAQESGRSSTKSKKKVTFADDTPEDVSIMSTISSTVGDIFGNLIDVLIIIGTYQIISHESIEQIYSIPFKKYYYDKDGNKSFYSYVIKFIIIVSMLKNKAIFE